MEVFWQLMKFQSKFALPKWSIWTFVGLGWLNIVLGVHASMVRDVFSGVVDVVGGVFYLLLGLLGWLLSLLVYSEMDATCLCVHRFWKKKEIAWPEVTSAGKFGFGTDDVIVRFGHQIENYGYILTQPADRDGFLSAIHQYAPHAKVDR